MKKGAVKKLKISLKCKIYSHAKQEFVPVLHGNFQLCYDVNFAMWDFYTAPRFVRILSSLRHHQINPANQSVDHTRYHAEHQYQPCNGEHFGADAENHTLCLCQGKTNKCLTVKYIRLPWLWAAPSSSRASGTFRNASPLLSRNGRPVLTHERIKFFRKNSIFLKKHLISCAQPSKGRFRILNIGAKPVPEFLFHCK